MPETRPLVTSPSARRRNRVILILLLLTIVLVVLYSQRERLIRGYVAYRVYSSRIFTPPWSSERSIGWSHFREAASFYWDFAGYILDRQRRVKKFEPTLKPLVQEIDRRQAAGQGMQYSMHIYREIRWRLNFTSDEAATAARIEDLQRSLDEANKQELAVQQQASDGSYALGINVWYLTLYYSVEDGLDNGANPQYRLAFLDRINSPQKLTAQLASALYDDLPKTGQFNREELDETFSALARLLFKMQPVGYSFDPGLRDALKTFVIKWQNPATGCWGQWIVDRHGRIWKMDDIGITFHVISDLGGDVPHLDMVAKRLLQLDNTDFPAGILFDGHYENHLNWDAVKIFRYAWPFLDENRRQQARAEMSQMLNWCLTKSLQPDGSFKVSELDDTVGDAFSYGVEFLRETGYFRAQDRFWTDQDFPDARSVHDRIENKIKSIGLNDPELKDAYNVLQETR